MWNDIDFENKTFTVNRQIQWHEKDKSDPLPVEYWYFTNPKYDSFRTISLDDEML